MHAWDHTGCVVQGTEDAVPAMQSLPRGCLTNGRMEVIVESLREKGLKIL